MIKIKENFAFLFVACVVTTVFIIFPAQFSAQCVTCAPSERVPTLLVCKSSASGGKECQAQGDTCSLIGVCRSIIPPGEPGDSSTSDLDVKIEIELSLIKQIAATHPRFAYALATVLKNDALGNNDIKIYVVPRPITMEDVEKTLAYKQLNSLPTENNSLSSKKGRVQGQEKFVPVIYEVSFQNASKLIMTVVQGTPLDPAFTKLEIDFVEVTESPRQNKTYKATNWRVE